MDGEMTAGLAVPYKDIETSFKTEKAQILEGSEYRVPLFLRPVVHLWLMVVLLLDCLGHTLQFSLLLFLVGVSTRQGFILIVIGYIGQSFNSYSYHKVRSMYQGIATSLTVYKSNLMHLQRDMKVLLDTVAPHRDHQPFPYQSRAHSYDSSLGRGESLSFALSGIISTLVMFVWGALNQFHDYKLQVYLYLVYLDSACRLFVFLVHAAVFLFVHTDIAVSCCHMMIRRLCPDTTGVDRWMFDLVYQYSDTKKQKFLRVVIKGEKMHKRPHRNWWRYPQWSILAAVLGLLASIIWLSVHCANGGPLGGLPCNATA